MLTDLGMKGFKIASCDITNYPLLKYIAKKKLPILLSTGASNMEEIKDAVKFIKKNGNNKIIIMHCTLCYPTKYIDANLSAINDIKKKFPNHFIGLSDHTLGIEIPSSTPLLGVVAIEKHFTFNKKLMKSADHWLSIDEKELEQLVKNVKRINQAFGVEKKIVLKCEHKTRKLARRSIVASKPLFEGNKIKLSDINYKRPGTGISPKNLKKILNKTLKRNIEQDQIIRLSDFKV